MALLSARMYWRTIDRDTLIRLLDELIENERDYNGIRSRILSEKMPDNIRKYFLSVLDRALMSDCPTICDIDDKKITRLPKIDTEEMRFVANLSSIMTLLSCCYPAIKIKKTTKCGKNDVVW